MKNTNNIDKLIESLVLENEALIIVEKVLTDLLNEKMDPVGEEDEDINNDGRVDGTDRYLRKRRGAIGRAIRRRKFRRRKLREDVETLVGIKVPKNSTRKHMREVAAAIANLRPEERKAHHDKAAAYFRKSNPRFNAQKFRTACGVSDGMEQSDYRTEGTILERYKTVSSEIRHLIRDKGYPQNRAVAAALQMKSAGKLEEDVFDSDQSSAASRANVKKAKRLLGANSPHAKALEKLHKDMRDSLMYYGISDDEQGRRISDPEFQGEKPTITPMAAKGWSGYDAMTNLDRLVRLGAIPKAERAIKQTKRNPGYDPRAAQAIANAYINRKKKTGNKK